jgi:BirA family biotin operon repressor/biotin-[acetyl-CoA-carboxylase] ligase
MKMKTRYQILNMLSDGNFYSGEYLGKTLGLSRTAIWKHLNVLSDMGIEVYKVRGRGYRLADPVELLDKNSIRSAMSLEASQTVSELEIHAELESTNQYLIQKVPHGAVSGHVCIAESQTKGKGTRGRIWISPFGRNIYLSLLWKFNCSPAELGGLSLVVGVAIARAIEELGVTGFNLKWPNDLIWNQKKMGGLLLEMTGEASGPCHVVIGVGINVSMSKSLGQDIDQPWVDLQTIMSQKTISRNQLTGSVLKHLCEVLSEFQRLGFASFQEEWLQRDVVIGKTVKLLLTDREVFGLAKGIDEQGALLLETEEGVKRYSSGEVSLRLQS